jgi:hypothetical protein
VPARASMRKRPKTALMLTMKTHTVAICCENCCRTKLFFKE